MPRLKASFPTILENALFIADAHHQQGMADLPDFLEQLRANPPSQLFLMGDLFQIFVGSIKHTHAPHILEQIESLSRQTPVFYFEGNHDLGLSGVAQLKNTTIYPRSAQPVIFSHKDKLYALAHGDLFLGFGYGLYIRLLANPLSLKILGLLAHIKPLYTAISTPIYAKRIRTYPQNALDFTHFAKARLERYAKQSPQPLSGVIEGHFHIGRIYQDSMYVSLPSFYCTKEVTKLSEGSLVVCPALS
ncbi:UDP-2,3-diacylglucosamine hydrolase [Helicobacter sp. NHP19-003]|uniref:UDP-2,3-diacylglucosamine hydrolase n=1 Tax=Helicobacter gastrocanis TaxID=2849641 RepID=A0ABN6I176_9HELI|nr:metallophosphoesterase [Helicobacter sp. NHP19-003]BCZ17304.1 UDP-2,3-diacylglucosamine hydrolase [Helicobacter sp. NHP19-003]